MEVVAGVDDLPSKRLVHGRIQVARGAQVARGHADPISFNANVVRHLDEPGLARGVELRGLHGRAGVHQLIELVLLREVLDVATHILHAGEVGRFRGPRLRGSRHHA
eukprot:scaffold7508_cov267-Pinguiococcus_pyrenoidosus.AAC.4